MNSFVLFPQALEPSMNFNISKIVYSAIHYLSAPKKYTVPCLYLKVLHDLCF